MSNHQIRKWEITHLQTGTGYNVCKNKQTSVKENYELGKKSQITTRSKKNNTVFIHFTILTKLQHKMTVKLVRAALYLQSFVISVLGIRLLYRVEVKHFRSKSNTLKCIDS